MESKVITYTVDGGVVGMMWLMLMAPNILTWVAAAADVAAADASCNAADAVTAAADAADV